MKCATILICCLKYSPVHNTLCRALGEPLRSLGYSVKYLLPLSLRWTVPESQLEYVTFIGSARNAREVLWDTLCLYTWRRSKLYQFLKETSPSILLFEASHPANYTVASLARSAMPKTKIWMLIHEPYVREKSQHGLIRSFLIAAQEMGLRRVLPELDGVIVPSEEAYRQIRETYSDFSRTVLKVPLLFEDRNLTQNLDRRFFSFIGHAVPAKGIDAFFEMVKASTKLRRDWSFQIATSTDISCHLAKLSTAGRPNLHVINKPKLKDEEIDQAVRESWAVLAPYRRVTQSGVLPVAFMHGTPLISTQEGGMRESIADGKTGYFVHVDAEFSEWEEKFCLVQSNFRELSANCRKLFLENFDAKHGPEFLRPMLNLAEPSG